jgi:hypothetical protein
VKRIRGVAGSTALVTAVLAVGLSGCSELSPSVITETYPASDGVNADLPGSAVALRNFLVIGAEKGAPAEVIGAVVNTGSTAVEVSFQADLGETAQPTRTVIKVDPFGSVQLGPDLEESLTIPELPVEPGATTAISAATTTGGRADIVVPVLRPEDEYESVTPAPTTEAPTKKPKPSESEDSTDASATEQPTGAPDPVESSDS